MRTRSAEKKAAGKNQTPTASTPPSAAVETKRTPPSRAKQAKTVGSTTPSAAEEAKTSNADEAVQSTPEAKPPSGRKTTRKVVRKVVKKVPAASNKTPRSANAEKAVLEEPGEEEAVEDSKEDSLKEKDVAEPKDSIKEGDSEDLKDHAKEGVAEEIKKSIKEEDAEDKKEEEDPVKEEVAEDKKENPVKEEVAEDKIDLDKEDIAKGGVEDPKEDAMKEKKAVDLKEDIVLGEDAKSSKEDTVEGEDVEDRKEDAAKEKDTEDLKEDIVMGEDGKGSKEDAVEEEDVEDPKEDVAKEKDTEDSKEDIVMEERAEGSKEDAVKEKDANESVRYAKHSKEEAVKENDAEDSKEDLVNEDTIEDLKEKPVEEEDKEDPTKEKDVKELNEAGPTPMYESYPKEADESSRSAVASAQNVDDSVMEDQNGNKEEQTGHAQEKSAKNTLMSLDAVTVANNVRPSEEIVHDIGTSENQGPIVTSVKSQDPGNEDMKSVKAKEELELSGENDNGSAPIEENIDTKFEEDGMEEDTDKKMKGKDISLDEAGEDKIEAFADQEDREEFVEDDVSEHCEEAETLEDERAQLNALARERMKRKELEVFVGGLDRDAMEEDVKRVFQHVGEVVDVRMHRELSTNKNKGYAFVKFATKEQVSRALAEMRNPVIRGKRCGTAPSEDNDTLFLGNICNTWTKEAVRQKLKDYGVEAESITLVADPKHEGLSRGFAFLEFACHNDAATAYKRLQRPDVVFGHSERSAKVAFAEPLRDPDPDIMAQVKSVFIDGLPPYWDEDRVREKFKCFGEIARVTLARNMSTAKRKDFGFVDFNTHEAAVACVEGTNNTELGDGNLKAKVRVRLSNPLPKTQAVKGGISGGFRISRGPMGRGLPRGGRAFGRANFSRGRGFQPRGPAHGGRMGFAEHEFAGPYPPFRGRSNFGRGGRWSPTGAHPVSGEGPMFVDRMRHGGHANDAFFRREQIPIEGPNRPFMGRHFEDRYYYDNTGLKRPLSMTDPDPDYLGPSRRPRFDHPDPAGPPRGDRYRDNFPPGGDQYARGYYGSDYGRGQYPSFYGGERPYGRGFGRGYY